MSITKYHWAQNRLDSMTFTQACQDNIHSSYIKNDTFRGITTCEGGDKYTTIFFKQ